MSKKSSAAFDSGLLLQICLAVFFLVIGILGVTSYNSNTSGVLRFFGKNDTLNIVIAIVEIIMGALLILGLVVRIAGSMGKILGLALPALWAVWMVMTYFVNKPFEPTFLVWLSQFSRDLVVLVSLWIVGNRFGSD